MATTVCTESTLEDLLEDLISLDYDAADAIRRQLTVWKMPGSEARWPSSSGIICGHVRELSEFCREWAGPRPKKAI